MPGAFSAHFLFHVIAPGEHAAFLFLAVHAILALGRGAFLYILLMKVFALALDHAFIRAGRVFGALGEILALGKPSACKCQSPA